MTDQAVQHLTTMFFGWSFKVCALVIGYLFARLGYAHGQQGCLINCATEPSLSIQTSPLENLIGTHAMRLRYFRH